MLAGLNAVRVTAEVETEDQDFGKLIREKGKICGCEGDYRSIGRKNDAASRKRK